MKGWPKKVPLPLLDRLREVKRLTYMYLRGPRPNGEMAQDCFDLEFDRLMDEDKNLTARIAEFYQETQ